MIAYSNRPFERDAKKAGLTHGDLCEALAEIESGLIDAHLGGELIKKRLGVAGRGKRGGLRSIVVYRRGFRTIFVSLFAKNRKNSLNDDELDALKLLARQYLRLTAAEIAALVGNGMLIEVKCNG